MADIPDEAVEAAARAIHRQARIDSNTGAGPWHLATDSYRLGYCRLARYALEAAAEHVPDKAKISGEAMAVALQAALKRHIEWRQETAEQVFTNTSALVEATARAAVEAAAPLVVARALEREPTSERQRAAEEAIAASWPHLAQDPVHVEQLAAVALNAAFNPSWRDGLLSVLAPEAGRERSPEPLYQEGR